VPDAEPRVGASAVTPDAFERQLDAIAARRSVVSWPRVARALDGREPLPGNAALLTFDDGLVDHHRTVGPRLAARGWSAVFFAMARDRGERLSVGHRIHVLLADRTADELRSAVVERLPDGHRERLVAAEAREAVAGLEPLDVLKRCLQRDMADSVGPILSQLIEERHGPEGDVADELHLSEGQIAGLRAAGMTIGGHGRRHLWLDHEPAERVRDEVRATARWLVSEPRPWAFAYPYGAPSPTAVDAFAAESAFGAAFLAAPRAGQDRWHLGRIDAEDGALAAALDATGDDR
jgi:peptidoglycan/xylan/chitin deacetylase (PgdA/CDA1 family)